MCAIKGYPTRIVSSDAFAAEKLATMRAFGAELEVVPSPEGITPQLIPAMRERASRSPARSTATAPTSSRTTTWSTATAGWARRCSRNSTAASTRGSRTSAPPAASWASARALRERLPGVRRVAVEPAESAVLSGHAAGTHRIEGGGVGFVPPLLDPARDIDEVRAVPQEEAFAMARRAAREEGVWSGPSTGANLVAAVAVARELGPGHRVVTAAVDSGLKYLGGALYRQ